MANNDIRINLTFQANTKEAKAKMQELEKSLNDLLTANMQGGIANGLDKDLKQANDTVIKLHGALSRAFNVNTGKLDLPKFNKELKQLNLPLKELRQTLSSLGPEGQKSFQDLAQSVLDAEVPTKRLNKTISEFINTLKKTVGWQISSNIIHGLQSGLEGAFRYAEDLNKSLNDIRIVTGYNVDYMAKFADQANKAARSLSTSTNEYAKASLIYFQQGLAEQEVQQRTTTTIKLANVTGQTAEEVSSYMTAVWNNFADGTKELEYYADAITKLGAATASSSEEIATGLQKFSAVAETVGLSYEYATAALATVTSQTRESAETVGTAFKTIFARLESLSLGETLDDDTNMTKYSQALAAVGVNIKSSTGQLKNMDSILDELGSKWNSISKDQQLALAQTVAGMRQYNNFMALMNNYEKFSANVDIAKNSTGSLDEQAKIYAESWEAASQRVKAAAEEVYKELINDEFFVKLLNNIEKIINGIDNMIDSVGGLQGVLAIASALLMKFAGPQMIQGIGNMAYSLKGMVGLNKKEETSTKKQAFEELNQMYIELETKMGGFESRQQTAVLDNLRKQLELSEDIYDNEEQLSEEAKERLSKYQAILKELARIKEEQGVETDEAENNYSAAKNKLDSMEGGKTVSSILRTIGKTTEPSAEEKAEFDRQVEEYNKQKEIVEAAKKRSEEIEAKYKTLVDKYETGEIATEAELNAGLKGIEKEYNINKGDEEYQIFSRAKQRARASRGAPGAGKRKEDVSALRQYGGRLGKVKFDMPDEKPTPNFNVRTITKEEAMAQAKAQIAAMELTKEEQEELTKAAEEYLKTLDKQKEALEKNDAVNDAYNKTLEQAQKIIEDDKKKTLTYAEALAEVGTAAAALAGAMTTLKGTWGVLTDPDATGWEKIGAVFTGLVTVIPLVATAFTSLKKITETQTIQTWLQNAALKINTALTKENTKSQKENSGARNENGEEIAEDVQKKAKETLKDKFKNSGTKIKGKFSSAKNSIKDFGAGWKQTRGATKIGAKAAASSGGTAATSVASSLGSIMSIAGPILAAVAVIAGSIVAIKAIYEAAEKAAKKAEAQAQSLQEAVSGAKEEYQAITQSIDNFENAQNSMKELTKGTQEWRDALQESNDQARNLIDQFGSDLKAGDYYFTADGQIQFKEGVLEELQQKEAEKVADLQVSADAAKINAIEKREKANQIEFARDLDIRDGVSKGGKAITGIGIGGGAAAGALIGAIGGPIGAAIGAGVGAAVGAVATGITHAVQGDASEREMEAIDKMAEAYQKDSNLIEKLEQAKNAGNLDAMSEQIDVSEEMIEALLENKDATKELLQEMSANTAQSRLLTQSMVENANLDSEVYADSNVKEVINALATKELEDKGEDSRFAEAKAEAKKMFKGSNDDFWDEYVKEVLGDSENYRITNKGGGNVTVQKKDENGNWVTDETIGKNGLSEKDALEALAAKKAANYTDEELEELEKKALDLTNTIKKAGIAEEGQQNKIISDLVLGNEVDLSQLSKKSLDGLDSSEVDAQYKDAFDAAIENSQNAWELQSSYAQRYLADGLAISGNMTTQALSQLNNAMTEIANKGGVEAAAAFGEYANSLVDAYPKKAQAIAAVIDTIDWDQGGTEALSQMHTQLGELGIDIDTTSAEWEEMAVQIQKISKSMHTFNLDKFRSELTSINKLVNSIEFGGIVSDEDYAALKKYNAAVEELFMLTAEGYQYIGDRDELSKVMGDSALKQGQDQIAKLEKAKKAQATNKLDESRAGDKWGDMAEVGSSDAYAAFREATELDGKQLQDMAEAGRLAEAEISRLKAKESTEGLSPEEQKQLAEQQKILDAAIALRDEMYAEGETNQGQDFDKQIRDTASVVASSYSSLRDLEAAKDYFDEKDLSDIYETRVAFLQQEIELREKELDKYQDEQAAIKKVQKSLSDLNKQKENASGQKYLDLLKEESELQGKIITNNESLKKAAESKQSTAYADLQESLAGFLTEDQMAGVTSWEDLDSLVNANGNDSQREYYEETKKRYLEAQGDVEEFSEAIEQAQEEQRALAIESATYVKQFNDSVRDSELEWIESRMGALDDAGYGAAEKIALLGQKMRLMQEEAGDATKQLNAIAEAAGLDKRESDESIADFMKRIIDNAPDAATAVQEVAATYQSSLESMREIEKSLADSLVQHFEQVAEQYDKVEERIERLKSTTEHYKNIIDLVGKNNIAGSESVLNALQDMERRTASASLANSKAKYEKLAADRASAERSLQDAINNNDTDNIQVWKDRLEEINNQVLAAQDEMNNSWAAALQTAADIFAEQTTSILESFESSLSGVYGSFDRMQEVFGQQSELNSQYVADYKRVYELSKMSRDLQNQIDNTDSVAAKAELMELQSEINQLQESGAEMSQYDLDYLQKRYDLRVAELALEEARNAKSQVRLQKTENGWGYVYTQNEDAVSSAQQNYEDKLYALQELSDTYLNNTSEKIISTQAEFESAIQTIMSSGLSDEEKKKQVEETVEFYKEKLSFLTSEFDSVIQNNQGIANMVQSFSDSLLGTMYPEGEFDSADNIFTKFSEQVGDWDSGSGMLGSLKTSMETFKTESENIFRQAGYNSMEAFVNAMNTFSNTDFSSSEYSVDEDDLSSIDEVLNNIQSTRTELVNEYKTMIQDYTEFLTALASTKLNLEGSVTTYTPSFNEDVAEAADGGYTGSWGSEGKFLKVHEKELILDKEDTANLLSTIKVMDNIIKAIDMASAAQAFSRSISPSNLPPTGDVLQQEVTIHAEFPNVKDRSEIENALENLISRASQYAGRRK